MKKHAYTALGLAIALAACQTTPPKNPALEEARAAVSASSADASVNAAAAVELQRAREALARAERAWEAGDEDETRSRAYIARQRAAIASEVGARYSAEQSLQQTSAARERILAEARAREAQLAEQRAREAAQQAASAQAQAQSARAQAQSAQAEAQSAQAQAANAQAQAEAERQRVEAQQRLIQEQRERAQRLEQDLAALAAKKTDRGVVVTLQDVLFDTGKAELRTGGLRSIQRIAGVLNKYPERRVMVEGFTDSQGSDDYNMELSQRRADAVKQQLESQGVADERIETRAHGEAYPVADNGTAAGRQQNRRVEIVFSDANGKFPSSR